jgi:ABC-type multidrug transport system ATPase subunit
MLLIVNLVSRSWVLLLASITPTEALMNILNGLSLVVFSIFSGFLNPRDAIPPGWIWAYYISYFTWSLRGLLINEQVGLVYDCPPAPAPCAVRTGSDALALFGMDGPEEEKWYCILWMAIFLVGMNVIAAYAMIKVNVGATDREEEPNFEPGHTVTSAPGVTSTSAAAAEGIKSATGVVGAPGSLAAAGDIGEHDLAAKQALSPHSSKDAIAADRAGVNADGEAAAAAVLPHVALPVSAKAEALPSDAAGTHVSAPQADAEKQGLLVASKTKHSSNATAPPLAPGYISWRNLRYTVTTDDGKEKRLLDDVVGFAAPGMLVALMGASGAGKTTLLDVLAGKKTGGEITGELLVNGLPRDQSVARIYGYCEQSDSHNERSSVREAVRFSAMLRLPASITSDPEEVDRRVTRVLDDLGILRLQHDLIGNANTGGISQEARKKVTIAVELIGEPRILFLDEPTTGLDSAAALSVMDCVVALSQRMAVLCTVHQPSEELFAKFNYLCLLQPGGRTVYFGPVKTMAAHFEHEADLAPYDPKDNLADYAIQCAKATVKYDNGVASSSSPADAAGKEAKDKKALDLKGAFLRSKAGKVTLGHLDRGVAPAEAKVAWEKEREILAPKGRIQVLAPFGLQFRILLGRFTRTLVRSPDLWFGRVFANVLMSFIIATCFFRLGSDQASAQGRVSCLFLSVNFMMGSGALKLPAIFSERAVVFRERQAMMYNAAPYYLARWCHDLCQNQRTSNHCIQALWSSHRALERHPS